MRICLMGDSHAAALRKGWSRIHGDFPQFEIQFFAGTQQDWSSVAVEDRTLVPSSDSLQKQFEHSSRGQRAIAGTFDAYILSSLRLQISLPLRLWTHQRITDWGDYRVAATQSVQDTACAYILSKLRQTTSAPVLLVAAPHQPIEFCRSSPLLDLETAHRLAENFTASCEVLAAEHAAVFIPQPSETLASNRITTRMEFANPSTDSESEDRRHCNADYDAIAMKYILERISPR